MEIGDYLIKARKIKGLSQEEVANRLNVSRQSVSLWETNQTCPTVDNLMSLSKIYDVSISYLMGQEDIDSIDSKATERKIEEAKLQRKIEIEEIAKKKKEELQKKDSRTALMLTIALMCLFFVPYFSFMIGIAAVIISFNAFRQRKCNINLFSLVFSSVFLLASFFATYTGLLGEFFSWGRLGLL